MNRSLLNEIEIFHLIYTKHRSQQRSQRWWRYVAMAHRRLIRLVQHGRVEPRAAAFLTRKLIPSLARALHSVLAQGAFITLGFALLACTARIYTLLAPSVPKPPAGAAPARQPQARDWESADLGTEVDPAEARAAPIKAERRKSPRTGKQELEREREPKSEKRRSDKLKSDKPNSDKKAKKSKKERSGKAAIDDIFG